MEAGAIRQPDFPAAADGLRLVADQLALCPNLPALDAGAELMRRMDLMLEQQRQLNVKFDDLDRKMNVSNRNFMARLENSIVVSGEMALAPVYDVATGQEVRGCPETLAELEALTPVHVAELLRSLGETVPRGYDERKRRLKLAFGVRTRAV